MVFINRDLRQEWFPLRITILYIFIGLLWFFWGHRLAIAVESHLAVSHMEMYKDIFDVFLTALLVYLFMNRHVNSVLRAKEALKEAEEKYRSLVEGALVGVYVSQNGCFSYMNESFADMFGYTTQEIINIDVMQLCFPGDRPLLAEKICRMTKEALPPFQIRGLKKDGTVIPLELHGVATLYNGKPAVIGMARDISERKEAEELLRKSDKLAVVGQLAAGVAHEIRNPLAAIRGFLQLMQSTKLPKQEYFDIMLSELDRINSIVTEFLFLAKPQAVKFQGQDLRVLLDNVVALLATQAILNNIEIVTDLSFDALWIECEEYQLKQVFINILKNSIEAMPAGGQIRIEGSLIDGKEVLIRVMDEGCGIPAERISKLGEPFYTTKEKGTGLGLMISYKIIESHNGQIQITSEKDQGTTVDIVLPVS